MHTRTSQGQNFQDTILERLCHQRRPATLYLNNRMALHGRIVDFDPYVLLLEPADGSPIQMIYKSAVVSVTGPPARRPPPRRYGPPDAQDGRDYRRPSGPRPDYRRSDSGPGSEEGSSDPGGPPHRSYPPREGGRPPYRNDGYDRPGGRPPYPRDRDDRPPYRPPREGSEQRDQRPPYRPPGGSDDRSENQAS